MIIFLQPFPNWNGNNSTNETKILSRNTNRPRTSEKYPKGKTNIIPQGKFSVPKIQSEHDTPTQGKYIHHNTVSKERVSGDQREGIELDHFLPTLHHTAHCNSEWCNHRHSPSHWTFFHLLAFQWSLIHSSKHFALLLSTSFPYCPWSSSFPSPKALNN